MGGGLADGFHASGEDGRGVEAVVGVGVGDGGESSGGGGAGLLHDDALATLGDALDLLEDGLGLGALEPVEECVDGEVVLVGKIEEVEVAVDEGVEDGAAVGVRRERIGVMGVGG